jgi:hypothetical protein
MRLALFFIVALLTMPADGFAAPKADLWEKWKVHDPASTTVIDHAAWESFLSQYISASPDGINRVAYARVTARDKNKLQKYLLTMGGIAVSGLNRPEQRAYWINLYNALTLKVILEHYPVSTIRKINISPGFFSSGPWGRKLIKVEGEYLSLDDIEHRILRPIWKDPRLHYGVNCASIGCPNLQAKAFTAANGEILLDKAAGEYINHPRGAQFQNQRLIVSSIYRWFKDDFGGDDPGVIEHLKRYAKGHLRTLLTGVEIIDDDDYNWSLNE